VAPKLEDDTKTEKATDKPSASTQPDAPDYARLRIQSGNQLIVFRASLRRRLSGKAVNRGDGSRSCGSSSRSDGSSSGSGGGGGLTSRGSSGGGLGDDGSDDGGEATERWRDDGSDDGGEATERW
jgi:hypothetical protein